MNHGIERTCVSIRENHDFIVRIPAVIADNPMEAAVEWSVEGNTLRVGLPATANLARSTVLRSSGYIRYLKDTDELEARIPKRLATLVPGDHPAVLADRTNVVVPQAVQHENQENTLVELDEDNGAVPNAEIQVKTKGNVQICIPKERIRAAGFGADAEEVRIRGLLTHGFEIAPANVPEILPRSTTGSVTAKLKPEEPDRRQRIVVVSSQDVRNMDAAGYFPVSISNAVIQHRHNTVGVHAGHSGDRIWIAPPPENELAKALVSAEPRTGRGVPQNEAKPSTPGSASDEARPKSSRSRKDGTGKPDERRPRHPIEAEGASYPEATTHTAQEASANDEKDVNTEATVDRIERVRRLKEAMQARYRILSWRRNRGVGPPSLVDVNGQEVASDLPFEHAEIVVRMKQYA